MADDELTNGEIRRTFARHEQEHRDIDDRLTELARKSLSAELWAAEKTAMAERLEHSEKDLAEGLARVSADLKDGLTRVENAARERLGTVNKDIKAVRDGLHEHERAHSVRAAWSRKKTLTVIGILVGAAATIAGAWIAALIAAKGVG